MNGCRNILLMAAGAFGLAVGGGLVYGLYVDSSVRVLVIFIAGGFVMSTPIFVLAVWALRLANNAQQRVTHNYSYKVPSPQEQYPPSVSQPMMTGSQSPALGSGTGYGWPVVEAEALPRNEDEIVA